MPGARRLIHHVSFWTDWLLQRVKLLEIFRQLSVSDDRCSERRSGARALASAKRAPDRKPGGAGRALRPPLHAASDQAFTAALARVRVLPEIKPFFHGVGFAIIGPQSLIAHEPGAADSWWPVPRQRVQGTVCGGSGSAVRMRIVPRPRQMGHREDMGVAG